MNVISRSGTYKINDEEVALTIDTKQRFAFFYRKS